MKRIFVQLKNYLFPKIITGCCMCKKVIGLRSKLALWYHPRYTNELIAVSHTYCRKCQKIKDAEFEAWKKEQIERRIKSGFYDSEEPMQQVAEQIQNKYRRDTTTDMMMRYLSGGHLQ